MWVPEGGTLGRAFLQAGEGWAAWDTYQEDEAYRVEWRLAAGQGEHRVPKGRRIQTLAVHLEGRYRR